jgi:hypothetical protein
LISVVYDHFSSFFIILFLVGMTMLRWRPCHHDLRKPAESYEMSEEVKRAVAEGRPRTILMKLKFKVGNGIYIARQNCQILPDIASSSLPGTELPDIARLGRMTKTKMV